MTSCDADYYRARAVAERELAKAAAREGIAGIHRQLAERYEGLASEGGRHRVTLPGATPKSV